MRENPPPSDGLGASNGGLSAFYIASKYPKYVRTLIGYPGLLEEATPQAVNVAVNPALLPLPFR